MLETDELVQLASSRATAAKDQIREKYMEPDERPWIIGFSGGKDSTLVTQLVFEALLLVPPKKRVRPIFVLSSDTLVETPYIIEHIKASHFLIEEAAASLGLPLVHKMVTPELNDTFWVRLIGFGYPPPSKFMRWCTDRLKIKPANKFILQKVSEHGEVVVLLGTRYDESHERGKQLRKFEREDGMHVHASLPRAHVWAPIRFFTAEEVWAYLIFNESPWGGDNRALRDLYKSANAGECPLVIDETTEPCGNSRFGCFTCTVVERDKSMEGFIAGGHTEFVEMLEFRNWLVEIRENQSYRQTIRRNGEPGIGPLTLATRREVLERLLGLQSRLGQELISREEIAVIKQAWVSDSIAAEEQAAAADQVPS